jgi:hypothetical protein
MQSHGRVQLPRPTFDHVSNQAQEPSGAVALSHTSLHPMQVLAVQRAMQVGGDAFLYQTRSNTPSRSPSRRGPDHDCNRHKRPRHDRRHSEPRPERGAQNADHKGYLKRRGQITSEAYQLVSFPNAPRPR